MNFTQKALPVALCLLLGACGSDNNAAKTDTTASSAPSNPASVTINAVVEHNAQLAFALYSDALTTAEQLHSAIEALVSSPSAATHQSAKDAWLAAREPYGQSEIYRFRAGPIDDLNDEGNLVDGEGPEGRLNAWPLGEAVIDYVANAVDGVAGPENADSLGTLDGNIINDTQNFPTITAAVLKDDSLSLGSDERNVIAGYHAIEFLLWGQDLNLDGSGNGERDSTAGQRPWSDYATGADCTNGHCDRRGDYLKAASELLINDLTLLVNAWNPTAGNNYYTRYIAAGESSLKGMLESMGRMGYGELAAERINAALIEEAQEDEHSCFSDNTHRDIYLNFDGIRITYSGDYTRVDGTELTGAGIDDLLVAMEQSALNTQMQNAFDKTASFIQQIDDKANMGIPFDIQIEVTEHQTAIKETVNALAEQKDVIEDIAKALNITLGDLTQDTEQDLL
ncbi:imelysin family protein [Marinagarivorans algicola]|uniref:imelysin family protein n=1 Tax=Marinagarivorans algicola TaxID=1513270 RepID=UPI0006B5628F|nr:imelysin family protein [Marinagarivorans algicola]